MPPEQSLAKLSIEDWLLPVLIQLAVIVTVARLFGMLFRRLRQPTVVGEIMAGILLGPSVFGLLWPSLFQSVFHPPLPGIDPVLADDALEAIFSVLAQIGLLLLLFLVGLEFNFEHLKSRGRAAFSIMFVGIAVPFLSGLALAPLIHPYLENHPLTDAPVSQFSLSLFMGTAMSITALPVLGRILMELGISRTRLAAVVIAAAALGDAVGWILLASVTAVARSRFSPFAIVVMVASTLAFFGVMQFLVRPWAKRYFVNALVRSKGELTPNAFAVLLVLVFVAAVVTNLIGIFGIFGAFSVGAILSGDTRLREAVSRHLYDFVAVFFVPVFFTYTGLRTEIGSLQTPEQALVGVAVIAVGFASKFIGCAIAARWSGFSPRESAIIGGMMNTRGLMELIVINVGYDLGVIPKSLFCILVLMAILSNLLAMPVGLLFRRGTEIEAAIEGGGFTGR